MSDNFKDNDFKAPWRFGTTGMEEDSYETVFLEKPFSYHGKGYCYNPYIYDAEGNEVVGCDEYYVFSGEKNVRLLCAAPELLEACEAAETILRCCEQFSSTAEGTKTLMTTERALALVRFAISAAKGGK